MPRRSFALAALLVAAACTPAAVHPAAKSPSPRTAASLPACRGGAAAPAGPPGARSRLQLWTVASGLDQPDDLLFHAGSLLIGELGAGRVRLLSPGQPLQALPVHIASVEGMVYVGGDLYAAGQAEDVVDQVQGSTVRTVLRLNPVAGQDGVDSIGAQAGELVVPDSPRGVVDWVDPATGRIVKQVGGFSRPTGVWNAVDGSLLVADEYGDAVVKLAPDGSRSYAARSLPIADDVAQTPDGAIYVVAPAAAGGRLVQVLPGGASSEVATGLAAPQGLAVDGAGNLYFSEEDAGRVDLALRTFKLVPPGPVAASTTQPVCVRLARASAFAGAVTLTGGPGLQIVAQPDAAGVASVLVTGCRADACTLTATAGGLVDTIAITSS